MMSTQLVPDRDGTPTTEPAEANPVFWIGTELVTIKAGGSQTEGVLSITEHATMPHGGPPLHRHSREDETFYVLEGEFLFFSDGRSIRATAGMLLYQPRGTVHTYTNTGDGPGTLLVIAAPAGLDEFFAAVGLRATSLAVPPARPTSTQMEQLARTANRFGIDIVGPPLG